MGNFVCPEFTVLMAVYAADNPSLFAQALASVFSNSIQPLEVIVVLDGPIGPQLRSVMNSFLSYPHLRTIELPHNQGLAQALNVGLQAARTEWIVRADSDDVNAAHRFARLSEHMTADIDLLGSAIDEFDPSTQRSDRRRAPPQAEADIRRFMRSRSPFNHMSVAFRRSKALACGGYPNLYLREDYGLWVEMASAGARMRNLPDVLVRATAGRPLYARRGGWRYALGEIGLQRLLVKNQIKSPVRAVLDGGLRMAVFLAPMPIRSFVYRRFLRARVIHPETP